MFTKKTYPCVCHVCGKEFDKVAEFFNCPVSRVMPDGTTRGYTSCGDHTKDEIKAAYHQMYTAIRSHQS